MRMMTVPRTYLPEENRWERRSYGEKENTQEKGGDTGVGVLLLTNNCNAERIFDFLQEREPFVWKVSSRICLKDVEKQKPFWIVSYNYNYLIPSDVIEYMNGRIVNLHISLLPWNRGFSPNIWSFIDNTPKGVTIHQVNAGLDTGDILVQKELFFHTQKETFASTYETLNREIQDLFIETWEDMKSGRLQPQKQTGRGTYHCKTDLEELQKTVLFTWETNIADFLNTYRAAQKRP